MSSSTTNSETQNRMLFTVEFTVDPSRFPRLPRPSRAPVARTPSATATPATHTISAAPIHDNRHAVALGAAGSCGPPARPAACERPEHRAAETDPPPDALAPEAATPAPRPARPPWGPPKRGTPRAPRRLVASHGGPNRWHQPELPQAPAVRDPSTVRTADRAIALESQTFDRLTLHLRVPPHRDGPALVLTAPARERP